MHGTRSVTPGYADVLIGCGYSDEQLLFLRALDRWKCANHCPHPNWKQVLAIARSLGYRRVAEPVALPVFRGR